MRLKYFHELPDGNLVACQSQAAKTKMGIKFYCPVCHRYIIHVDERHCVLTETDWGYPYWVVSKTPFPEGLSRK